VNDEHDIPVDPALREVWQEMGPAERRRLPAACSEQPPPELSEALEPRGPGVRTGVDRLTRRMNASR
jgi:hypothetical protein